MKVLVLFSVLFVTIFILVQHVSSISSPDKETYELFVQLIKGEFAVPVKSRTIQQKSALVRFWQNQEKLSLRGGRLCYDVVNKDVPVFERIWSTKDISQT